MLATVLVETGEVLIGAAVLIRFRSILHQMQTSRVAGEDVGVSSCHRQMARNRNDERRFCSPQNNMDGTCTLQPVVAANAWFGLAQPTPTTRRLFGSIARFRANLPTGSIQNSRLALAIMRLPSAYALTATLAYASLGSAQLAAYDAKLVGTWSTKSNKTLTGPVC